VKKKRPKLEIMNILDCRRTGCNREFHNQMQYCGYILPEFETEKFCENQGISELVEITRGAMRTKAYLRRYKCSFEEEINDIDLFGPIGRYPTI